MTLYILQLVTLVIQGDVEVHATRAERDHSIVCKQLGSLLLTLSTAI
jgi:uncharacterized protein YsxB (DUF464 family)